MLNKDLIKNNFQKSILTYDENAIVQKQMAEFLCSKIQKQKYNKILEIGSYTGKLTKLAVKKFDFDSYLALDVVNSFDFIKNLSPKISFIQSDIEKFETSDKFDLIISNASIQWAEDFEFVYKKLKSLLTSSGHIAISLFGHDNLLEIKEIFNVGLKYHSVEEIEKITSANIYSEIKKIKFKDSISILKHLKATGVNSVTNKKYSYKELKQNLSLLEKKYNNTLTYNPIYVID